MNHVSLSTSQIYRWPVAIALITFAGLLSALFGDGIWNVISWFLLAILIFVIGRKLIDKTQ